MPSRVIVFIGREARNEDCPTVCFHAVRLCIVSSAAFALRRVEGVAGHGPGHGIFPRPNGGLGLPRLDRLAAVVAVLRAIGRGCAIGSST